MCNNLVHFIHSLKQKYILVLDYNRLLEERKLSENWHNQRQANKSMFPQNVCLREKGSLAFKSLGNTLHYILTWKLIAYIIHNIKILY